jgi:hypothetical protein
MREYITIWFEVNLKKVKHVAIVWSHVKKEMDENNLIEVEAKLDSLNNNEGGGFLNENTKAELNSLEHIRKKLLENKEVS